jgi:PAS domain S-box-containing protein
MVVSSASVLLGLKPGPQADRLLAAATAAGMRALLAATRPALLDALATGGWDVLAILPAFAEALPHDRLNTPPIVFLGDPMDAEGVLAAVRAGARDVVATADAEGFVAAVRRLAAVPPAAPPAERDDEARFRTLADSMPQLVWMARADGVVEYYNARWREYQGIAPSGDGWQWAPVLHADDRAATEAAWRKAVETATSYEIEHRVLGLDGLYRWHVSRGVPHLDAHGRVRTWYGTATDIDALKQAQEHVQQSEERLRLAAEAARMYAFEWDPRTDDVRRTAECVEILGDGERDTGRAFFARLHPDDRAEFMRVVEALTPQDPHYHLEYRLTRADGTVVFLEESARGLFDEHGTLVRLVGMAADVTRRREAERRLRETTAILRTVAESTPDSIYVKDRDGRIVFANPATLRYIGLPAEQVIGHTEIEFHAGDRSEAEAIMATDRRIMRTGAIETVEEPFRAPEGPRVFLSTKSPLRDEQDRIAGLVGISSDITERKHAERALRDSEQRLTIATEAAGLGVFEWDIGESRALWQNARMFEIFERARHEGPLEYPDVLSQLHPDDAATVARIIASSPRGGDLRAPLRVRRRDGTWRSVEVAGRFNREAAGRTRLIGIVADVSARVEQERERQDLLDREQAARLAAEKASLLKDQFLATLSHELRTPLNAVLGWAQLLAMRPIDDRERLTQILQTIVRNAQLQVRLIEDLLDMSRILSGKLRIDCRPTSVPAVLHAAAEAVAPAVEARQLALSVHVDTAAAAEIMADPERLQQVVWNLLANAVKFTDRGGRIDVRAEARQGTLAIDVTDTGRGIAPEFLPFVFDRFRQADGSTTRAHGGLGLGLSIARHLVELHGGTIEAHSEGEGRGARFRVVLPLVAPGIEPRPTALASLADDRGHHEAVPIRPGARVLIVDDHTDARELAAMALRAHGAETATASSVDEALAVIAGTVFDALVVDIGMPGRDGYDFVRALRAMADPAKRGMPALALTSFAHEEDRARALAAGFDAHVAKPVSPAQLADAVGALLRGRAARGA